MIKESTLHQYLPPMSSWDREWLKESIAHGWIPGSKIMVTPDGYILDGFNRYEICKELGIDPEQHVEVMNIPEEQRWDWVIATNMGRRHLTIEQRRALVQQWLSRHPKESNRSIAQRMNVDDKTVAKVRHQLEDTGEIPVDANPRKLLVRLHTEHPDSNDWSDAPTENHADHRGEMSFRISIFGPSGPSDEPRVRDGLPWAKAGTRDEWKHPDPKEDIFEQFVTIKPPNSLHDQDQMIDEICAAIKRELKHRPLRRVLMHQA